MTEATLPPLIQQMLQPTFYPHPVVEPIQLIQTHVSYVLLTGEYVYKLKKSVNFGFLDYSTLERRKHFCEAELTMNDRGAPGLYLEVLPIYQAGEAFGLSGDGEPVEYTLKMRQFPQANLFTDLYERGELTVERVEELARVVAEFHLTAATSDYVRAFGEVARIREAFDENYEQTRGYIGGPQTQAQFDETQAYTDRFFATQEALFAQRRSRNWIRECHGDLHLRNICLWNGKVMLFDCIEFNEPFRFVDVMFDIGYIVMDFEARQRPDLCYAFLNAYLERTGDWEGLLVLPIYVNRQSYVRAKVTSFLLGDPAIAPEEKQKAEAIAAQYYRLAWQYTQPRQGRLILMSGLSGAGKSTVAKSLAGKLGAVHLRSDAVRKHLAGVPLYERGGPELYTAEMTQKTYDRLLELGLQLAESGYAVILDAKYDRQALRKAAIAQAEARQIPLQILHCTAPESVLRDRLDQRTGDIADATADLISAQAAAAEAFGEDELAYVTPLDTTQTGEAEWESALRS